MAMYKGTLCDIAGMRVGHAQNEEAKTGVTAILCPAGTIGGVDVRGAAPGTRETDLLRCGAMVREMHAIMLCGGSAYGLAAADGAMRYLEEKGIGLDVGVAKVPIVPAAVLFDLSYGQAAIRPDANMGYTACQKASRFFAQGSIGAGTGATIGKLIPGTTPGKGGIGSASLTLASGATVAAIAAVNAVGDIYNPHTGSLIASGTMYGHPMAIRDALIDKHEPDGDNPRIDKNAQAAYRKQNDRCTLAGGIGQNTTIGVVATDAKLTKEQVNRLALMAHDGLARTIFPAHTEMDGDTIFALATSTWEGTIEMISLGAAAAEVFARAILNAVEASQ